MWSRCMELFAVPIPAPDPTRVHLDHGHTLFPDTLTKSSQVLAIIRVSTTLSTLACLCNINVSGNGVWP